MISRQMLSRFDSYRKQKNYFMVVLLFFTAIVTVVPLLLVFYFVLEQGIPALNFDFFTQIPKPVGEAGGGMANAIVGSLILVLMACLLAVPWGIASGIYLSEYGHGKLADTFRFFADLLLSVPSIIVGMFAYTIIVVPMGGFSAYAGAFALAVIMVPSVARATEEILKLTPSHIREAGLALGIPRWRVILSVVLKGSLPGVFTGILLAIARAFGETAPLLLTSLGNQYWSTTLSEPMASIPVQIYNYATSPYADWHRQAWAGAFVLVLLVFAMNLSTRLIMARRVQPRD